jgi:hypothetical protein
MTSLREKQALILDDEERFAFALARQVLETPKLSFWMILIPIILVYHMFRHRRVVDGRKGFVKHYLIMRKKALEETLPLVEKGRKPRIDEILKDSNLPEKAKGPFKGLFSVLVDHYADLLRSDGPDVSSLVRSAYRTRTNYLLFINRLGQAEKALNNALRPYMDEQPAAVDEVMKSVERFSEQIRREEVARIFSR